MKTNAPEGEVLLAVDGLEYKIGRHNKVFKWNDEEWTLSSRTSEEIKKLYLEEVTRLLMPLPCSMRVQEAYQTILSYENRALRLTESQLAQAEATINTASWKGIDPVTLLQSLNCLNPDALEE